VWDRVIGKASTGPGAADRAARAQHHPHLRSSRRAHAAQ
jgi:hypothetical protein